MIVGITTIVLLGLVIRIVYLEVTRGRAIRDQLAHTNTEIARLTKTATTRYHARFGKDPTGVFERPPCEGHE